MDSEPGEIPADVRQLLEAHPWDETSARLLWHAQRKIRRLTWRASWRGDPPGGIEPHDIVYGIYEKVLAGTRRWDPVRHPDLFEYLRDQVDSEISNLVTSSDNTRVLPSVPAGALEGTDSLTPEEIAMAKMESDEFVLGFMESLQGEPELQQVVDAFVGGVEKQAEIAKRLNTSVEQINLRRKRLKRRLEEYLSRRAAPPAPPKGGTRHG